MKHIFTLNSPRIRGKILTLRLALGWTGVFKRLHGMSDDEVLENILTTRSMSSSGVQMLGKHGDLLFRKPKKPKVPRLKAPKSNPWTGKPWGQSHSFRFPNAERLATRPPAAPEGTHLAHVLSEIDRRRN